MPVNQQKKTGQARLRQAIEAPTNRGLCNLKANKTVFTQTVIRAFLVGERNAYHQPSNRAARKPNTKSSSCRKSESDIHHLHRYKRTQQQQSSQKVEQQKADGLVLLC